MRYCNHCGMVLMGKPKPENVTAGVIKKNDVTSACCGVAEIVEISNPTPSMQSRNRIAPLDHLQRRSLALAQERHVECRGG